MPDPPHFQEGSILNTFFAPARLQLLWRISYPVLKGNNVDLSSFDRGLRRWPASKYFSDAKLLRFQCAWLILKLMNKDNSSGDRARNT